MKTEKIIGLGLLAYAVLEFTKPPRYIPYVPPPSGNLQNNYNAWLNYAKSVTNSAVNLYGSINNAIQVLWGPGGPFEKTPVPVYDAGSIFWKDAGYGNIAGIGRVHDSKPPGITPCADGKYSDTRHGRGVCSYHGGSLLSARAKVPGEPAPPAETFEAFVKRRAHEMATESKENTRRTLKNSGGSFTSTWLNSEARKAYEFDYRYYTGSDSRKWLKKEYEELYGVSIGAIYPQIPALYECNDGTFTTSDSPRGCTRHGGKRSGTPVQLSDNYSGLLNIRDVPLDAISIDRKLFQGREKAFSERSVLNIIQDVDTGRFLWENLDPIILWQSPDGKFYLLSGHSRLEAFRRLAGRNATAQGKAFSRIPAKILQNVPVDVAQTVALESNTLSTKETDLERAAYYRRLRQEGTPEKTILDMAKKNEGRNWTNIYAYTFLSPSGSAWATLRQFAESEDTSATIAKSLGKWLGQARRQFPILTNEHEGEIYRWLFEQKGYGTGRNQVSSEREFLERVGEFVQKNTFFGQFDTDKPLNIQNLLTKSPAEQEYDIQIDGAKREVQEAENDLRAKIRQLASANASKTEVQRITQPLETRLRNARLELQRLLQAREKVIEYSKSEPALFGCRRMFRAPLFRRL